MSDQTTIVGVDHDRAVIEITERSVPRDALYAAAFSLIDRCWVRLDRRGEGRIGVELRSKGSLDMAAIAADFARELAEQTFRQHVADAGRATVDDVIARAFGHLSSQPVEAP